jgi:hypothetical protein
VNKSAINDRDARGVDGVANNCEDIVFQPPSPSHDDGSEKSTIAPTAVNWKTLNGIFGTANTSDDSVTGSNDDDDDDDGQVDTPTTLATTPSSRGHHRFTRILKSFR